MRGKLAEAVQGMGVVQSVLVGVTEGKPGARGQDEVELGDLGLAGAGGEEAGGGEGAGFLFRLGGSAEESDGLIMDGEGVKIGKG